MIASISDILKFSVTFSNNNVNYIIALITMQIPLCIYVLDKSSGVLKYSFVKKAFCKKTNVILITKLLLILLCANAAYAIAFKELIQVFFAILIADIIFTVLIFKEYSTIISNIASFNDTDNIGGVIISAIDECLKKGLDEKKLHEIFEFVIFNDNDQYYSLLLNKLNELNKNDNRRLDVELSNYVSDVFSKKYGHIMNYMTYKTIYDENSINQLIVHSIKDLHRIEILR